MHDYPVDRVDDIPGRPAIVSVPDVHGYRAAAERALQLPERYGMDPVIDIDGDGTHWAGNDYVAVFNGDLVDRGPDSPGTLTMVRQLRDEAPPGRVVQNLGNHELPLLLPDEDAYAVPGDWSAAPGETERERFLEDVAAGYVTAAFEGYTFRYAHAGRHDRYSPRIVNDRLQDAGERLLDGFDDGGAAWQGAQARVAGNRRYGEVLDLPGEHHPSGLVFGEFPDLGRAAPPQVVGHTPRTAPQQAHGHINGNTLQWHRGRPGGESVVVEEPGEIYALVRSRDGGARRIPFETPRRA